MDSFHTCATQMLKEFRALLHISPIPINSHRILQLLSLNMYAIDCNALKCTDSKGKFCVQYNGRKDFFCDYQLVCYCCAALQYA